MPTSCWDLQQMGHKLSGFFSVKGSKKMEMIYCDFYPNQNGITSLNFICYCSSKSSCLQTNRNGSDTSTSNRRPSISTSREILHFTKQKLRFRSIWRWWTRETPWIWRRGNSRQRDREFIFSLSWEWRVLNLHLHLLFRFLLIFIWTGIESGRVLLKRVTPPLINSIRWPSSQRWTWKQAINSGWRLDIFLVHPRIYLTKAKVVTTTPISRVSCWRRKLPHPFEVLGSTSKIRKMNVDTKIWGREF